MVAAIGAAIIDNKFEGQFSPLYVWEKLRRTFPESIVPKNRLTHEDRRAEWLTYQNVINWIDGFKKLLVDLGFVKDEPCIFPGMFLFIVSLYFNFTMCKDYDLTLIMFSLSQTERSRKCQ